MLTHTATLAVGALSFARLTDNYIQLEHQKRWESLNAQKEAYSIFTIYKNDTIFFAKVNNNLI